MANYEKPDFWAIKAQKEGFPARSVYKLKEMDEKFGFLKNIKNRRGGFKVLDLGAAPGSWSLYVLKKTVRSILLVSIDLSPLADYPEFTESENFIFIRGDMTIPENREKILSLGPYDLILSDAAPSTTGSRSVDTLRSLALAETALNYAETALTKGGNLAVKVFQGGDTAGLLKQMRGLFENAKSFKPEACRAESFETYYLGLGKK